VRQLTKPRLSILTALLCAAIALAVAGCGGGDDSSSTTVSSTTAVGATGASGGAPLSTDEFITQADAICTSSNDEVDAQAQQVFGGQQPTDAQLAQFINDTLIPSLEDEINGIDALTPPAGDEDQVQAIIDAVNTALDKVKANPQLVAASANNGPFAEADQLAKAYGLKVCGQG
jgi:hypothetical protein